MKGRYPVFILLFSILIGKSFASTDTLDIYEDFSLFIPQTISAVTIESPSIENRNSYNFEQSPNQLKTKTSILVEQYINYHGSLPMNIILETGGFHYVDIHLINTSNLEQTHKKTGVLAPYPENELFENMGRINKVRLTLSPNTLYRLLIIYSNPRKERIDINLSFYEEHEWSDTIRIEKSSSLFWLGLFFGTLILLSLINFVFYYLFKDGTYIVYVAYILTIAFYESMLYGFLDPTWLKHYPMSFFILNNTALFLFIIFYLVFLRSFLNLKSTYPRWNKVLKMLIAYLILMAIISDLVLFSERLRTGYIVRNFSLLFIIPVAITFLINVLFSKRLIDRVFFTGSIFLVVAGLASILSFFDPSLGDSDVYLQIGIMIELVIFNIGLGMRSKIFQNEKDRELQNLNASLEEKVAERTHEINNINKELTSQRDQLFHQNETIEQNLQELDAIRQNLEQIVNKKTKELKQANKGLLAQNAQLEQYAFITAHNLKAPVARLKGLINIFELTNLVTDKNVEVVDRLKEASQDMDEVISDINKILQVKNFSEQQRKEINLQQLIDKISRRLEARASKNKVVIKTDLQVERILSIDTYIESILYNLINNGIKYHRADVDSFVEIQSYKRLTKTIIKVKDNGVGIDLDKFGKKVFGLYQRFHDHVNGKGIGLYLVKTQTESLNGKIEISSTVNEGTEFKLVFPTLA